MRYAGLKGRRLCLIPQSAPVAQRSFARRTTVRRSVENGIESQSLLHPLQCWALTDVDDNAAAIASNAARAMSCRIMSFAGGD